MEHTFPEQEREPIGSVASTLVPTGFEDGGGGKTPGPYDARESP